MTPMALLRVVPPAAMLYAGLIAGVTLTIGALLITAPASLPNWLAFGVVDPEGNSARPSPGAIRLLGVGCVLASLAVVILALANGSALFLGFGMLGVALLVLLGAAASAFVDRRRRSLRVSSAVYRWQAAGFVAALALSSLMWILLRSP